MIKLNDVMIKIKELEKEITERDDIVQIDFYTDESGSIHSSDHEYFSFGKLKDLKQFLKLDIDYILRNRKKYPIRE